MMLYLHVVKLFTLPGGFGFDDAMKMQNVTGARGDNSRETEEHERCEVGECCQMQSVMWKNWTPAITSVFPFVDPTTTQNYVKVTLAMKKYLNTRSWSSAG